jgi:cell division transport system permease protein
MIEDQSVWSGKMTVFGKSVAASALVIGGLTLLCISIIIFLITKASLQAYFSTLDILRLMGARNSYIAGIFQAHIMRAATGGGGIGFCLSLPVVYVLIAAMQRLGLYGEPFGAIAWRLFGTLLGITLLAIALSVVVSRVTVLLHLKRLDG